MKKLTKDVRLLILIGLVFLALALLTYPMIFKKSGVVVTQISEESPCKQIITEGSVITEVADMPIQNQNDFYKAIQGLEGPTTFIINDNPRTCDIPSGSVLNITVKGFETKGLKFGVDVKGGTEILLKPASEKTFEILKSRAKSYEITNVEIEKTDDSIRVLFDPDDEFEIKKITKQGIFEAKFLEEVQLKKTTGELVVNGKGYEINLKNETLSVNGSKYKQGEVFVLEGLEIEVYNITNNITSFYLNVFDDKDITKVLAGSDYSRVVEQQGGYVFVFGVELSEQAGENFAKATKGQKIAISSSGESYLRDPVVVFLDGETMTAMPVLQTDAGKTIKSMSIWGFERTKEDASEKMLRMLTVLESGRLPEKFEETESKRVPPEKKGLFNMILYGVIGFTALVSVFAFARYRKPETVLFVVLIILIEIILILGMTSSRVFAFVILLLGVGLSAIKGEIHGWSRYLSAFLMFLITFAVFINQWVLDVPSLAGLSVMLFVSIGQVIITSEIMVKEGLPASKKYEKVVGIIWKIALVATIIATPLFFLNPLKGLGIALGIGIMITTTMTKPLYASLLEKN